MPLRRKLQGMFPAGTRMLVSTVASSRPPIRLKLDGHVTRPLQTDRMQRVISVSADTSALGYDQLTIGTDSGSVKFSGDGGKSWRSLGKPRPDWHDLMCIGVAEMDGIAFTSLLPWNKMTKPGDTLAAVYRTTDSGASWDRLITPSLTDTLPAASWLYVHLFRDGTGKRILFVDNLYHLWRSTDDGDSWWEDTTFAMRQGWKRMSQVNGSLFMCAQGMLITVGYDSEGNPIFSGTARQSIALMTRVFPGSISRGISKRRRQVDWLPSPRLGSLHAYSLRQQPQQEVVS